MISDAYMALKPDMSGSRSKNRFRQELLWGISKMLDCMEQADSHDFAVVFDYLCDIEVHIDEELEFYQVKTSAKDDFGTAWATRKKKNSEPIVVKLYRLNEAQSPNRPVRLFIVGNKRFKHCGGYFDQYGELVFSELSITDQQKLEASVCGNLNIAEAQFENMSYLLVSMDLLNPENAIRGRLIDAYQRIMGCEPVKPNALYMTLSGMVRERACYEFELDSYETVIDKKGLTRSQLIELFGLYEDRANNSVEKANKWIEQKPPKEQRKLKLALADVVSGAIPHNVSNKIMTECRVALDDADDALSTNETLELMVDYARKKAHTEVEDEVIAVCAAISLFRYIEGYDNGQ